MRNPGDGGLAMISQGSIRAEKIKCLPDGEEWCCIWRTFPDADEDMGLCWDFLAKDLDDLITLLQELRDSEPEPYDETSDHY